jgi:hypothetical protein
VSQSGKDLELLLDMFPKQLVDLDQRLQRRITSDMDNLSARHVGDKAPSLSRLAPLEPASYLWMANEPTSRPDAIRTISHILREAEPTIAKASTYAREATRPVRQREFDGLLSRWLQTERRRVSPFDSLSTEESPRKPFDSPSWEIPRELPRTPIVRPTRPPIVRKGLVVQSPPAGDELKDAFRDINWQWSGSAVQIVLVGQDGVPVRLAPAAPGLIHLAIVSAAEPGEWLASFDQVTDTDVRSVWLSAALTDTRLGCQLLRLDQLGEIEVNVALARSAAILPDAADNAAAHTARISLGYTSALAAVFWSEAAAEVAKGDGAIKDSDAFLAVKSALSDADLDEQLTIWLRTPSQRPALHDRYLSSWLRSGTASASTSERFKSCVASSQTAAAFRQCARTAGEELFKVPGSPLAREQVPITNLDSRRRLSMALLNDAIAPPPVPLGARAAVYSRTRAHVRRRSGERHGAGVLEPGWQCAIFSVHSNGRHIRRHRQACTPRRQR